MLKRIHSYDFGDFFYRMELNPLENVSLKLSIFFEIVNTKADVASIFYAQMIQLSKMILTGLLQVVKLP